MATRDCNNLLQPALRESEFRLNTDYTTPETIQVCGIPPSLVSRSQDNIVHQGWLDKRGEYIQNWRKRYFFLMENGQFLGFHRKPTNEKIADPENKFSIKNCKIILDNKPKPYTFTIQLSHGNTIVERVFSVDTEQERFTWITLIEDVKLKLNGNKLEDVSLGPVPRDSTQQPEKITTPKPRRETRKLTFENFEFLKVLGKGTYGKVVLCREKATSNLYSIKVIKKDMVIYNETIRQILTEKRVLQKTNHPFLLSLKYSFTTCDHLCLVTEFVKGGELYFHLAKERPFSEHRSRFYGAEMISAIDYLHTNNIIHRDLKLENILLDKDGHIRIIDFGLCKENIQWNCETNTLCGTPEYRSPEIILHDNYGKVVDWWAFGIIMCEMLIGYNPFFHEDRDVMFENVLEVDIKFPTWLSLTATDLLSGLLSKEPTSRLGRGREGSSSIKSHPFFEIINWEKLLKKEIPVPFKPDVSEDDETINFDSCFTGESVRLTSPIEDGREDLDIQFEGANGGSFQNDSNFHRKLFKQFSYNSTYSGSLSSSQQSLCIVSS